MARTDSDRQKMSLSLMFRGKVFTVLYGFAFSVLSIRLSKKKREEKAIKD